MRLLIPFLLFAGSLSFALNVNAQSLGLPVVKETFGSGPNPGGPLPAGVTNLIYTSDPCPQDNYYTIVNTLTSSCYNTWFSGITDHTGDSNGYFMVINASYTPSVFYTQVVKGSQLCPGTTYLFNAYIMNLLKDPNSGSIKPNITFRIESSSGTLLAENNSGDIPPQSAPQWKPYGMTFVSPNDGSDVVIKMINNAPGGIGNDLILDDITFSPYGIAIPTGFNTVGANSPQNHCAGEALTYTLKSDETGYNSPSLQWQKKLPGDADWVPIPGATSKDLPVNIPNAAVGTYQYRIGVLDGAKTSPNCIIYSDPLTINVYPYPINTIAATTSACVGLPLVLSASGGDTYEWTSPSGTHYSSSNPNTTITPTASVSDNGVYHLKITTNGCPTFATTTVTVYPPATIDPILQPAPICEGSSVTLTTTTHNATHYKWSPPDGLDHDDIANPIASPAATTTYNLTVSNDGCAAPVPPATVTVKVLKSPQAIAGQTVKIFAGQAALLNGTAKGDNVNYYWTPNLYINNTTSLTPTVSPPQDQLYTLHVISNAGCGISTDNVFVRVYQQLTIPNTFTPNGDGKNDKWDINNLSTYPNALLTVYNRNGQPVFQSRGYPNAWDGTYNGAPLPAGTYYYVIDLQEDNLPKPAGWVLIVR